MPSARVTAPIRSFSQSSSVFGSRSTVPVFVWTIFTASKMLSEAGSIMKRISSFTETMGFMSPQSTCVGVGVEEDCGVEGLAWEHAHRPLNAAIATQTVADVTFFFMSRFILLYAIGGEWLQ